MFCNGDAFCNKPMGFVISLRYFVLRNPRAPCNKFAAFGSKLTRFDASYNKFQFAAFCNKSANLQDSHGAIFRASLSLNGVTRQAKLP